MNYDGKIYSGDGHIDLPWLPADLFVANAPADTNVRPDTFSNVVTATGQMRLMTGHEHSIAKLDRADSGR